MQKMTVSLNMLRPQVENGNGEIVGFGVGGGSGKKLAKKLRKLSKGLKLSKSRNSKGKIWLSPKNYQKVGIYLILMLRKPAQAF